MKTLVLAAFLTSYGFLQFDDTIYTPDPCVEVMRAAMEHMEPFVPQHFKKEGKFWSEYVQLTEEDKTEQEFAWELWRDTQRMCWRH
jgi:hypothetical protein